jgi:hypothetical protein
MVTQLLEQTERELNHGKTTRLYLLPPRATRKHHGFLLKSTHGMIIRSQLRLLRYGLPWLRNMQLAPGGKGLHINPFDHGGEQGRE